MISIPSKNKYIYNLVVILITVFFIASCTENKKPNFKKKNNQKKILPPSFNSDSAYFFVKKQVDFGPRVISSKAWLNCSDWLEKKLKNAYLFFAIPKLKVSRLTPLQQ